MLDRVVSLLRRRGVAVWSLVVGRSEAAGVNRLTLVVDAPDASQVVHQLRRLIGVLDVCDVTHASPVERETALLRVSAPALCAAALAALAHGAGARVVHADDTAAILEITDRPDQISAFVEDARALGAIEVARTGCIAIGREDG